MTPTQLKTYLNQLLNQNIKISTMIWGAPGIGKSSIVSQVAQQHNIDFVDVRLSQAYNAFNWLIDKATAEWIQLFAVDMFRQMRRKGQMGALAKLVKKNSKLQKFFKDFQELVGI